MTHPQRSSESGMTLLELLVVLALLGLLGGLVSAGLGAASGSWRRAVQFNAEREEQLGATTALQQLLSQIVPRKIDSWSSGLVQFRGSRGRVQFLAPLARRYGTEDIVLYAIALPGDGRLHLTWQLDRETRSGAKSFAPEPIEEVFEGFSDTSFAYFGQIDKDTRGWSETWQDQPTLPEMIRLSFRWRDGDMEELIVAPRLTAGPCLIGDSDESCSK